LFLVREYRAAAQPGQSVGTDNSVRFHRFKETSVWTKVETDRFEKETETDDFGCGSIGSVFDFNRSFFFSPVAMTHGGRVAQSSHNHATPTRRAAELPGARRQASRAAPARRDAASLPLLKARTATPARRPRRHAHARRPDVWVYTVPAPCSQSQASPFPATRRRHPTMPP